MSEAKLKTNPITNLFKVAQGNLHFEGELNSYVASDIASFLRNTLLEKGVSFAFETVFSHESKLDFMKKAKEMGYKVYFYFLATDDPLININRVDIRVEKHGHAVDSKKIVDRYYRSLGFLVDAVRTSYRAFLFDNSGLYFELVAKIDFGKNVELLDYDKQIPNWFVTNFYDKVKKNR